MRTSSPATWADPRTGRLAEAGSGGSDGDAVKEPAGPWGPNDDAGAEASADGPGLGLVEADGDAGEADELAQPTTMTAHRSDDERSLSMDWALRDLFKLRHVGRGATARCHASWLSISRHGDYGPRR
jgi:hypothetical protein